LCVEGRGDAVTYLFVKNMMCLPLVILSFITR